MIDAHDGCILGNAHSIAYSVSITLITIPLLRHSRAPLGKKVMWAHTFFGVFSVQCPAVLHFLAYEKDCSFVLGISAGAQLFCAR